jgi:biotin synthase
MTEIGFTPTVMLKVEAQDSKFEALGEKPKWSRPEHKIDRNLEASGK